MKAHGIYNSALCVLLYCAVSQIDFDVFSFRSSQLDSPIRNEISINLLRYLLRELNTPIHTRHSYLFCPDKMEHTDTHALVVTVSQSFSKWMRHSVVSAWWVCTIAPMAHCNKRLLSIVNRNDSFETQFCCKTYIIINPWINLVAHSLCACGGLRT